MIILLFGEDTYRSRQKLKEIIKEYQTKHRSGLNLIYFRENELNLDKVKEKIEAVSMFNEKKLLILENVISNKNFSENFFKYVSQKKLKENQDIIIVIYEGGKSQDPSAKFQVNMSEEFKLLTGAGLVNWIKKEVNKNKAVIEPEALKKLTAYVGNDLWQMSNEISKLVSYKNNQLITSQDVDLLVKAKLDINIFALLDALAQRDKKTALKILHRHLNQGENEIYLFSMFIYQLRNLVKLKDLVEKGLPFNSLAKQTGLHPFVIKKSWQQLRNFSLEQLKKIYQHLLEIDLFLKTGRIDGQTALDILTIEI